MTIFDVLALIGGLCLFLFGMNIMVDGLERRAGNSLKALLGKLTNSRIKGFLTGLGVTAVIQSSSATTVMVVGFVNSGIMTLRQSIGVIMGANIGTTVTAWIISMGAISGDNIILKLLKPMSFTPVLALIGTIFMMFAKSDKKKDTGSILLGFAVLMFGMDAMSDAVAGLAELPWFREMFILFTNPILGVLVGALLTAIIQSSSASVGILQALSATGQVTYGAAVPILMGQHIGTCVTALLSSIGTSKNAKRAAVVHLSFNVIGTVVWLTVFTLITSFVDIALINSAANAFGIAVIHTVISVLSTILLLPMSGLLEKLACKLVPDGKATDADKSSMLDERLLATPTIALDQCS
ncbi:MAG: Na/Pi cotransporter family protein, partial [Clostridia bacterium]|nr:Na/Pi cotransporter family protein [Clostridia bacterium]